MTTKKPYIISVLANCCPRCRQGNLFQTQNAYDLKRYMKMNKYCPVCGQPTELEVGFYYGTGYVSYALTVAFSIATFAIWWILFGFSIEDNSIFYWLGANSILMLLLQPPLMRLSRSIWISWFVKYDAEWQKHAVGQPERIVKDQMDNW